MNWKILYQLVPSTCTYETIINFGKQYILTVYPDLGRLKNLTIYQES
jgi:hypothetical protein